METRLDDTKEERGGAKTTSGERLTVHDGLVWLDFTPAQHHLMILSALFQSVDSWLAKNFGATRTTAFQILGTVNY